MQGHGPANSTWQGKHPAKRQATLMPMNNSKLSVLQTQASGNFDKLHTHKTSGSIPEGQAKRLQLALKRCFSLIRLVLNTSTLDTRLNTDTLNTLNTSYKNGTLYGPSLYHMI